MVESRQSTIWGLGIAFPILAIIAVVLRFQVRRIKGQKLETDDWTILAALVLSIALTVDILIMTQIGGLGAHAQYDDDGNPLDPDAEVVFGKTIFALELLTWPTVGLTKISVLCMYKRIFSTPRFRAIAWISIGVNIAWTIAFTFALMFSCMPIQSQWDFSLDFTCVDLPALFTTALATDVATDFLVLLLPVYKVWRLQMPQTRRIVVIYIFLLGGLVSVLGIIRIHFLTQILSILDDSPEADTTFYYWTVIETNVGIISACLPVLRPIQERLAGSLFFSRLRDSFTHLLSSSNGRDSKVRENSMEQI